LFVFGATDSGKNLVTGTSYTTTFATVTTGSDSIGTYVENSTGGQLQIKTDVINVTWPNSDYSYFVTFSREGSPAIFSALFKWLNVGGGRDYAIQGNGSTKSQRFYSHGAFVSSALDLSSIAASTEFTIVYVKTGTTAKIFIKGGGSAISQTGVNNSAYASNIGDLQISGWSSGEYYPGRFRAFGRWSRALSDAEAQSMADNPQQIITPAVTYTYARPTSDITKQWTTSAGADHYALIDEPTASDADYIYATAAGQTDTVKLAAMAAPTAGTDVVVSYRVQGVADGGKVQVSLMSGSSVIKTDTERAADGDYSMTVAPGDYAGVTDWSSLGLRFVST